MNTQNLLISQTIAFDKNPIIKYGIISSPFGEVLAGIYNKEICYLRFINSSKLTKEQALNKFFKKFKSGIFVKDEVFAQQLINPVFCLNTENSLIRLNIQGTDFQIKVWQALLGISRGTAESYSKIAEIAGNPTAVRAVGSAVGENPVHYIIPCHRAIRKNGDIGGYEGGIKIKEAILKFEQK